MNPRLPLLAAVMENLTYGLYTVVYAINERFEILNLACIVYGPGHFAAAVGNDAIERACATFGWSETHFIADAVNEYIQSVADAGETFEERKAFVDWRIERGYPGSIIQYRTPYGTAMDFRPTGESPIEGISKHFLGDGNFTEWLLPFGGTQ